jgi:hypothetical protein
MLNVLCMCCSVSAGVTTRCVEAAAGPVFEGRRCCCCHAAASWGIVANDHTRERFYILIRAAANVAVYADVASDGVAARLLSTVYHGEWCSSGTVFCLGT